MKAFNINWNSEVTISREMTAEDYRNKNVRYIGDSATDYACLYENQVNDDIYIEDGCYK